MDKKNRVAVLNKNGKEIGAFYYPTDAGAKHRYTEGIAESKKAVSRLYGVSITRDGYAQFKSGKPVIQNAEKIIFDMFDNILGYTGAHIAFFSQTKPFARVKGSFYCDHCLNQIEHYIFKQEAKAHGKEN